jgi:hypothetical protein
VFGEVRESTVADYRRCIEIADSVTMVGPNNPIDQQPAPTSTGIGGRRSQRRLDRPAPKSVEGRVAPRPHGMVGWAASALRRRPEPPCRLCRSRRGRDWAIGMAFGGLDPVSTTRVPLTRAQIQLNAEALWTFTQPTRSGFRGCRMGPARPAAIPLAAPPSTDWAAPVAAEP